MSQRIFYLSDYQDESEDLIAEMEIPEQHVLAYEEKNWDYELHDWITKELKGRGVDKLIIPLSISISESPIANVKGLEIALHIRLNYELSIAERSIPIVFVSDFTIENILNQNNFNLYSNPQYLLFTKGIAVSPWDAEELKNKLDHTFGITEAYYFNEFFQRITIKRRATTGKHDMANAWGCFRLAQVTGLTDKVFQNKENEEHLKSLYSKYLIAKTNSFNSQNFIDLEPLKLIGKRILFIDDQADEGWADLMSGIFRGAANFLAVDSGKYKNRETKKFHDFEGFYQECLRYKSQDWDLIIIDLRLHPEVEDIDGGQIKPTELSGYKLIDAYLKENEGNQIMVSTASNKIWNINAALERGAQAYYIKESPEYNYGILETQTHYRNFKGDIKKCFEQKFLREIYSGILKLQADLDESDFSKEIISQLHLFWNLLSKAQTQTDTAFAYVSLYMIIEIINDHHYEKIEDNQWKIKDDDEELLLENWTYNLKNRKYEKDDKPLQKPYPAEWLKIAGLYFQKWKQTDERFIGEIYRLIRKRNGFIHGDKSILDFERNGKYENRDVYDKEGIVKLFKAIEKLISFL